MHHRLLSSANLSLNIDSEPTGTFALDRSGLKHLSGKVDIKNGFTWRSDYDLNRPNRTSRSKVIENK
jgi:hypothetical protein